MRNDVVLYLEAPPGEHLGIGIATAHGMIGGMIGGILPNKYLEAIKRHQCIDKFICNAAGVPFHFVPKLWILFLKDEVWALYGMELSASEDQLFRVHGSHLGTSGTATMPERRACIYSGESLARPCDDMLCHPHQTSLAAFLGAGGIADSIDHGNPNSRMY
ncbi:hypothetical protein K438DRAFT_1747514 [Mycena galopus ATCC 62051]|nr:hypothetical protein K438DRAFT_1747514 [Mycena galopus ATCC 62051]